MIAAEQELLTESSVPISDLKLEVVVIPVADVERSAGGFDGRGAGDRVVSVCAGGEQSAGGAGV